MALCILPPVALATACAALSERALQAHSENRQEPSMAEFQAIEAGELSEPNHSLARDSTSPASFAISLDPGTRSSRWALEWLVFAASLAVHVVIVMKVHNQVTPQVTRFVASQVDIELAPPVIEEPKVKEPDPPPEPPPPSDKPIPRVQSHAPV